MVGANERIYRSARPAMNISRPGQVGHSHTLGLQVETPHRCSCRISPGHFLTSSARKVAPKSITSQHVGIDFLGSVPAQDARRRAFIITFCRSAVTTSMLAVDVALLLATINSPHFMLLDLHRTRTEPHAGMEPHIGKERAQLDDP